MSRLARRLTICLVITTLLALGGLARAEYQPAAVAVDKPLYVSSQDGWRHFVEDDLGKLVVGQKWSWHGREYEVIRFHAISNSTTTQARQANRDYDAPVRGFGVAVIHLKVDGKLTRGRVELNAAYVWQPAGWAWEQVILYLGGADSYDFVTRKMI